MLARTPIVRHFIACDEAEGTPTPGGWLYALRGLIYRIRPHSGAGFPRIQPSLCFFVMLTDGHGIHQFSVEMVYWHQGEQESVWKTKSAARDLGVNPLAVHGWPIRLHNVLLKRPGDYDFVLWCDGNVIARETINIGEA